MSTIPKIIHQIWLGSHVMPTRWMDSWRKLNPDMGYNLWTNYQGFYYQNKIKHLVNQGRYACAADIMRVEILYHNGGVYVDADSIALEPIQDAPFMESDFWACKDYTGWIANGTIGAIPEHPIMADYFNAIDGRHHYWEYGARMLTACLEDSALILPTCTFYPTDQKGNKAPVVGKIYAEQYWATTRGKY